MPYELVQIDNGEFGERWPFGTDEITIGRSDKATVSLEGGTISRQHVRLWVDQGAISAEDLGSRNGVKINGVRTRSGSLNVGDRLEVGKFVFAIASDENPNPELVPKPAVPDANAEGQATQRRMLQDPDACLNAALAQSARLQTFLFEPENLHLQMLKMVMQSVPAQRAYLVARQPGMRDMQILANVHRNESDGPNLNATTVEHVYTKRSAVIVGDVSDPEYTLKHKEDQPGVICAPLMGRKRCLGVVYVDSGWTPSRFVSANFENLKAFGIAFGILLENAIMVEEMKAEAQKAGETKIASALGKNLFELAGALAADVEQVQKTGEDADWAALDRHASANQRLAQHLIGFGNLDMLSRNPLNVNSLVERTLAELAPDIEAKSIAVDFRHDARAVAYADQHQFHTVVSTILRMATELCGDTEGLISITTENKTDGCYFIVKNNGSGLPASAPAQIAGGLVSASELGASGIALAYCNAIVNGHKGKLRIRTDENEGCTFTVVVPQQESAAR